MTAILTPLNSLAWRNPAMLGSYLLIALGFTLPISVALGNAMAGLILLTWLAQREFRQTWEEFKRSPLAIACALYVAMHVIGLAWTEDMAWGLVILKKQWIFLMLPIFMHFVRHEHLKHYLYAFLAAMSLSELLSYGIWFEVIPPFRSASVQNPTPFMSHISYNPFLAVAVLIVLDRLLMATDTARWQKWLLAAFFVTMSVNMFITGGRAGQAVYFVALGICLFVFFRGQLFKTTLITVVASSAIFGLAYTQSTLFQTRVNSAFSDIQNLESNANTSVGQRITFARNSWEIIKSHPIVGVGTGDFKNEYEKINQARTPSMPNTVNPHNMYVLVGAQLGLAGLGLLLAIFYTQIRQALRMRNQPNNALALGLPLIFLAIMLSDAYLLGHFTTLLFIYLSSFIYKTFDHG